MTKTIKFLPYPYPKNYRKLLGYWLKKNPWVKVEKSVKFPLLTKVLGTSTHIKENTIINGPMTIKGSAPVIIGKYCSIAENLFIISSNHNINKADLQGEFTIPSDINKGTINIGHNVWIGDNVTILPGVIIGNGAVIGAGSVVSHDIPSFAVVGGVPAKIIKYRFPNNISNILTSLSWWHWNIKTIKKNIFFFKENLTDKNIFLLIDKLNYDNEEELTDLKIENKSSVSKQLNYGWSHAEKNYIWAENDKAELYLKTSQPSKYQHLNFLAHSFYLPQNIVIYINLKKICRIKIMNDWQKASIKILNLKQGINTIKFEFERGFIPSQVIGKSKDNRKLYCCFKKIYLT
jgi:virginiamycin A acetyltransferase